ncbi:MAG: element excision factor XisH family protein [Microcoleus sp.]|uniref:element excision factor XisH family protein n=1 Tax=Microcoleus sp. TaxID=44472 RepID=UPI003C781404
MIGRLRAIATSLKLLYNRSLYLAIYKSIFKSVLTIELGQVLLKNQIVKLIVFDKKSEAILQWIPD